MTFDVEILLRERAYAVTDRLDTATAPAAWTEHDVEHVLKSILLAMNRVKNPDADDSFVALRGFSWIVEPTSGGVVIAIEIPMGAAVAGPFAVDQRKLDALITRVLATASPVGPVVH
jgi:hypothetical protein